MINFLNNIKNKKIKLLIPLLLFNMNIYADNFNVNNLAINI